VTFLLFSSFEALFPLKPSVPGPTAGFIFFKRKENEPKETLHLRWALLSRKTSTLAVVGKEKHFGASWRGSKSIFSQHYIFAFIAPTPNGQDGSCFLATRHRRCLTEFAAGSTTELLRQKCPFNQPTLLSPPNPPPHLAPTPKDGSMNELLLIFLMNHSTSRSGGTKRGGWK
jgi:hypothetical protein